MLEILSDDDTREHRRVLVHKGGLKFLVEAAKVGNFASRERACHAIGLIGVTRRCRGLLVEAGVVPALVDLFRDGDEKEKLLAGNALGDHRRLGQSTLGLLLKLVPFLCMWSFSQEEIKRYCRGCVL